MENIVSMVLVVFLTWCVTFLYHFFFIISTITEFSLVFIVIGLLINGVYYVWSITSIKRKMTKEYRKKLRLDADRRIRENPDCEATRMLYRKSDN